MVLEFTLHDQQSDTHCLWPSQILCLENRVVGNWVVGTQFGSVGISFVIKQTVMGRNWESREGAPPLIAHRERLSELF